MSGPTRFKITERLGPVGTLAKLPIDYREATLDFTRWLGPNEFVTSVEQHGIVVDPAACCMGSWSIAFDCSCCASCGCSPCCCAPAPAPCPEATCETYSLDGSTTIVTGGTAQILFAGVTPLSGYEISNPHPTEDLWVTDQGTAAIGGVGSFRVAYNGGIYTTPLGYTPLGPVSIIGATTGHQITARAWGGVMVPATPAGTDTNPLEVLIASVLPGGKLATVMIGQGTPGLTYAVSFLAVVSPSQRRKSVDLLVCIGIPMVDIQLPTPPPPLPCQFVTATMDLAISSHGNVLVNNTSGAELVLGLPVLPTDCQELHIKDIVGNAMTHNIVIVTRDGSLIDDMTEYRLAYGYSNLGILWTGSNWSIM